MMASVRPIDGGISTPVNKRGITTSAQARIAQTRKRLFEAVCRAIRDNCRMGSLPPPRNPHAQSSRMFLCSRSGDEFLHGGQDPPYNDIDPVGVRMQAVLLCQFAIGGHTIEKERIKHGTIFFGQFAIDALELAGVIGA